MGDGSDAMSSTAPPGTGPYEGLLFARSDGLWLCGIVAVHAALLAGVLLGPSRVEPPVTPPAVMGMLVAAPPPAEVMLPKPLSIVPELPKPRVVQRPKQASLPSVPLAPPSERAVTAPPVESTHQDQPEADAIARQKMAAPPTAVPGPPEVTPPRTDAAHLSNPAPQYPPMSRRYGEQGRVVFDVYILPDGSVGEIKLKRSSGHARLDEAAFSTVRRWRYVPAHRGDEPIPYWYIQPITFSLDT